MAQFTKKAILDAFLRLLEQMPLDKITVRDICADCQISRNTFYYHYGDLYALLEAALRREIQFLQEKHRQGENWYENLRRLFSSVSEHRQQIYHIYRSANHDILMQNLFRATEELFMEYVREAAQGLTVPDKDIQFICFSYQSMFAGMLMDWLRRGMHGDPADFLDRAQRLLLGNTRRMLEAGIQADAVQNMRDGIETAQPPGGAPESNG